MDASHSTHRSVKCRHCGHRIEPSWEFCITCGLRLDPGALEQVAHIEFLLGEVGTWPQKNLANTFLRDKIASHYLQRRREILDSLLPRPTGQAQPVGEQSKPETLPAPPSDVPTRPTGEAGPPPFSSVGERSKQSFTPDAPPTGFPPQPPPRFTPPPPPRFIPPQSAPAEPPPPPRSLMERLSDPTVLRWMVYGGASLFVVGTVVYLRDLIAQQVARPVVQAGILATVTALAFAAGVWLLKKTREELAGRGLILLGSLLIPANPWFLVHSGIIERGKNAWIVGLLCTVIYSGTAVLLGEALMLYLAIPAGLLTIFAFLGSVLNAPTDVFAWMLMIFSTGLLVAERKTAARESASDAPATKLPFSAPFLHLGHVGILVGLICFTALFRVFPPEFLAAWNETLGPFVGRVSHWTVFGVAALAAGAYLFTALTRRLGWLVYVASGLLLLALFNELVEYHAGLTTVLATVSFFALVNLAVSTFFRRDADADGYVLVKPLEHTAWTLAGICALIPLTAIVHAFLTDDLTLLRKWASSVVDLGMFAATTLQLTVLFAWTVRLNPDDPVRFRAGSGFAVASTVMMILSGLGAARLLLPGNVLTGFGILFILLTMPPLFLFVAEAVAVRLLAGSPETRVTRSDAVAWLRDMAMLWEVVFCLRVLILARPMFLDAPFRGSLACLLIAGWFAALERTRSERTVAPRYAYGLLASLGLSFLSAAAGFQDLLGFSDRLLHGIWMAHGIVIAASVALLEKPENQPETQTARLSPGYVETLRVTALVWLVLCLPLVLLAAVNGSTLENVFLGIEYAFFSLLIGRVSPAKPTISVTHFTAWIVLLHVVFRSLGFVPNIQTAPRFAAWTLCGYVLLYAALALFKSAQRTALSGFTFSDRKAVRLHAVAQTLWAAVYVVVAVSWLGFSTDPFDTYFSHSAERGILGMWGFEIAGILLVMGHVVKRNLVEVGPKPISAFAVGSAHILVGFLAATCGYYHLMLIGFFGNPSFYSRWEGMGVWLLVLTAFHELARAWEKSGDGRWKHATALAADLYAVPFLLGTFVNLVDSFIIDRNPLTPREAMTAAGVLIVWAMIRNSRQVTRRHSLSLGLASLAMWVTTLQYLGVGRPGLLLGAILFALVERLVAEQTISDRTISLPVRIFTDLVAGFVLLSATERYFDHPANTLIPLIFLSGAVYAAVAARFAVEPFTRQSYTVAGFLAGVAGASVGLDVYAGIREFFQLPYLTALVVAADLVADLSERRSAPSPSPVPKAVKSTARGLAFLFTILALTGLDPSAAHRRASLIVFAIVTLHAGYLGLRERGEFIHAAVALGGLTYLQALLIADVPIDYFPGAFLVYGFVLLVIALQILPRTESVGDEPPAPRLEKSGHAVVVASGTVLLAQGLLWHPALRQDQLGLLVGLMFGVVACALLNVVARRTSMGEGYGWGAFVLGCVLYVRIGLFFGYGLWNNIEVFSLPVGVAMLLAGWLHLTRRAEGGLPLGSFCIWQGAFLLTIPMLLHVFQLRFFVHQPSVGLDIALFTMSILSMGLGVVFEWKAPAVFGFFSLVAHLGAVVFQSVKWGQVPLAVYLATLGAFLFIAAILLAQWRNRLDQIQENIRRSRRNWVQTFSQWQ